MSEPFKISKNKRAVLLSLNYYYYYNKLYSRYK